MINVLFFGQLREQLNTESMTVNEDVKNIAQLKEQLLAVNPHWRPFLTRDGILVAVNHSISTHDSVVNEGDEVAFFPPVTGG